MRPLGQGWIYIGVTFVSAVGGLVLLYDQWLYPRFIELALPQGTRTTASPTFPLPLRHASPPDLQATVRPRTGEPRPPTRATAGSPIRLPGRSADESGLINPGLTTGVGRKMALALKVSEGGFASQNAVSALAAALSQAGHGTFQIASAFFSDRFQSAGYFDRVYRGDSPLLTRIGVFAHVDAVLLGVITSSCERNAIRTDMAACDVALDYRAFTHNGGLVGSGRLTERGAGFSRDDALVRGAELIAERDSDRLFNIPATH